MRSDSQIPLIPRSPFATVSADAFLGAGLFVRARAGIDIATLHVRKQKYRTLLTRVRDRFDVELPERACRVCAGDVSFVATSPDTFLATCEQAAHTFAPLLAQVVGDAASVSDQSDAYAVLRLGGDGLREILAKMIPVDLHPRAFGPGDSAVTHVGHIGAILWRLEDEGWGTPVFDILVYRSMASSFWRMLSQICGIAVTQQHDTCENRGAQ